MTDRDEMLTPSAPPSLALARRLPAPLIKLVGRLRVRSPLAARLVERATRGVRTSDVTIERGEAAGLRFNAGGSNPGYALGTSCPAEQRLLARTLRSGMTFYDVGANVGFFTILAARVVGPQGRIVAFEPLPENVAALRHNAMLNDFDQIEVVPAAVARSAGTAALEVREEPTWGRLLGDRPTERPTISVPVVAIDELLGAGELPPPELVKIDVEGDELAVLEGMERTLREHRPRIHCEVHGTVDEVSELLTGLGYRLDVLEPRDAPPREWLGHLIAVPAEAASS